MARTEAQTYNAFGLPPYQIPPNMDIANLATTKEARHILHNLLEELQNEDSKYEKRYGEWIRRNGDSLEEFLFRCLRREVLVYLHLGNGNVNSFKNIGGNTTSPTRAIYLHSILGLDKRTRLYIGQSMNLNARLKQHWNFRYRRDNPSLHYHALQCSIFDNFSVLASLPSPNAPGYRVLPGIECPDLLLNVLEMWTCLLLRTLQREALEVWLPGSVRGEGNDKVFREGVSAGLNVRCPLDQGEVGIGEWVDLSGSEDPIVREYWGERMRESVVEEKGVEIKQVEVAAQPPQMQSEKENNKELVLGSQAHVSPTTVVLLGMVAVLGFMVLRGGPGLGARPTGR